MRRDNTRKTAFTLAEVLITLGIIGVVAAVTLPSIIVDINERRNTEREVNIAHKITQAMDHMRATGTLVQYNSTEDFVNEFKKHIKIAKICNKDHLTDCWPTDKVIDKEGNEFEVSKAKTGENLNLNTQTNNIGLILADGATLILNYDPTQQGFDVGDRVTTSPKILPIGKKSKIYPYYTSEVTRSIDFVMDVNGKGKPNREKDKVTEKQFDIRSFRDASFTETGWEDGPEGKILYLGIPPAIDCQNVPNFEYCSYGKNSSGSHTDYWAGAIKACSEQGGALPTVSKLQDIQAVKGEYPSIALPYFFFSSEQNSINPSQLVRAVRFTDGAEFSDNSKDSPALVLCVK